VICGHCGKIHESVERVRECARKEGTVPKVTWGAFSAEDIDNAPESTFVPYEGPLPPAGVYGWTVGRMTKTTSKADNPMLVIVWENDGAKDKKFKGAPVWDRPVMTKQTMFRIRDLCAALGVTSNDFLNKMVADEDGNITKIGKLAVEKIHVKAHVVRKPDNNNEMRLEIGKYIPLGQKSDAEEDEAEAKADAKASKKGKKGKKDDAEPPF